MKLRFLFLFCALITVVSSLAGCRDRYEWNQKLTVTVETPEGEKSASSVTKIVALFGQLPGSGNEVEYDYSGEAVTLEVAPGRYLFALLGGSEERFYRALGYNYGDRGKKLDGISKMQGELRVLEPNNYPLLVTFANIADPASVQQVDAANLAASFGPGVKLKSITLEITDEPVTTGRVESVLGWWCDYKNESARLNASRSIAISTNELSDNLGTGAFRIGDCT